MSGARPTGPVGVWSVRVRRRCGRGRNLLQQGELTYSGVTIAGPEGRLTARLPNMVVSSRTYAVYVRILEMSAVDRTAGKLMSGDIPHFDSRTYCIDQRIFRIDDR